MMTSRLLPIRRDDAEGSLQEKISNARDKLDSADSDVGKPARAIETQREQSKVRRRLPRGCGGDSERQKLPEQEKKPGM